MTAATVAAAAAAAAATTALASMSRKKAYLRGEPATEDTNTYTHDIRESLLGRPVIRFISELEGNTRHHTFAKIILAVTDNGD